MAGDLPQFAASAYASAAYDGGGAGVGSLDQLNEWSNNDLREGIARRIDMVKFNAHNPAHNPLLQMKMESVPMVARRIVKVFVSDPNEAVPLENSLLYQGVEKLTDATDQELFFELDIKAMLDTHNEIRTKIVDKKIKDRTEYLEPIKIRELRMVVVTVAQF